MINIRANPSESLDSLRNRASDSSRNRSSNARAPAHRCLPFSCQFKCSTGRHVRCSHTLLCRHDTLLVALLLFVASF
ncbi:hypothetical protein Zmor_003403 [Zophobas morio]|uniref:Uncharacterized protein n=1 Tax=Zophobas morio TaxID=2755281 RepID=A0AA38M1L8_9CUCU|nr:hypothetical protein Zmor_003403 [Zophobas morio]